MTERVDRLRRSFSTAELFVYFNGWIMLLGCFVFQPRGALMESLMLLGLLTLPGLLFCGTLGYLWGGRKMFLPAAVFGASFWMLANMVPIIVWRFV